MCCTLRVVADALALGTVFAPQGACDARGTPHVARATHFVSHAWSYPFLDLFAALEAHVERDAHDGETAYLWVGAHRTAAPRSAASSR